MLQPVLRAPVPGRDLRADRRRAPLARGRSSPASSACPRSSAPHDDARVARARADREHGPRGPQPGRGGARLLAARRGARAHARGGRPPRRPLARRGLEPAAPARPARRGARPARPRAAHRGPRPRAADGARPRRPPPARPAPPSTRAGPSATPRRRRAPPRAAASRRSRRTPRRPRAPPGPGRGRRAGSATRSGARSAPTSGSAPQGEGYTVTLAFESLDEAMALAERLGAVEHA